MASEVLHVHVENLYRAYLGERTNGHSDGDFKDFCDRHSDLELFRFSGAGMEHAPRELVGLLGEVAA